MIAFFQKMFKRENLLVVVLVVAAILGIVGVPQSIGITTDQIILALLGVLALDTLLERIGYLERIENHIAKLENKINPQISA